VKNNSIYAIFGTCHSVWMIVWYAGWNHSTLHTKQSSIQSDKYQVSYRYSFFHLLMGTYSSETCREEKHSKKNSAPSWLYLQDRVLMYDE